MTTPGLGLDPSKRTPPGNLGGGAPAGKGNPPHAPDKLVTAAGTDDNCCCKPLIDALSSLISTICDGIQSVISSIKNWISPEPDAAPPRPASIPPKPKPDEKKTDEKKAEAKGDANELEELSIPPPCTTVYAETPAVYNHVKGRLQRLPPDILNRINFQDTDRMIDFRMSKLLLYSTLPTTKDYPIFKYIFGPEEGVRMRGIQVPPWDLNGVSTEGQKLIDTAHRYYSRPHLQIPCPVNFEAIHVGPLFSAHELFKTLARQGHGISLIESHNDSCPCYTPWLHMEVLQEEGIDTFFHEGLPYDMQDLLDAYFAMPKGSEPPPLLSAILDQVTQSQEIYRQLVRLTKEPAPAKKPKIAGLNGPVEMVREAPMNSKPNYYTLKDMVMKAQRLGIRVVGIEDDATSFIGTGHGPERSGKRMLSMNYRTLQIIKKEQRGKYLLHTGSAHGVETEGVTGLAKSLGLPTVLAKDRQREEVVGVHKQRAVSHAGRHYTPDFTIILEEPQKN